MWVKIHSNRGLEKCRTCFYAVGEPWDFRRAT